MSKLIPVSKPTCHSCGQDYTAQDWIEAGEPQCCADSTLTKFNNTFKSQSPLGSVMAAYKEKFWENQDKNKTISEWQKEAHELAKLKGFYDGRGLSTVEAYSLIASEAFEAIKDFRSEMPSKYYEGDKPCGEAIEMADIVLRVMDLCENRGWDLQALITEKHNYNKTRAYKHGKKL